MKPAAIVILGAASLPVARQIQTVLPAAQIYGLAHRTRSVDIPVDIAYDNFGETLRSLFQSGTPIVGLCAAGILIRTLAPLLMNKWQEPPVLAIAEDGSAVVPLLGGLQGVNDLARQIAAVLQTAPAITTTGELRFQTTLLSPPEGYHLVNPEDAKTFIAELLAGTTVKLIGTAPWLENSALPIDPTGSLTIQVIPQQSEPSDPSTPIPTQDCLVYQYTAPAPKSAASESAVSSTVSPGKLAIVGLGPGSTDWISGEVQQILRSATDWVGYKPYLDLAAPWQQVNTRCHASDNRVELDRARFALDLAAQGRTVAIVSSGDPGIYAMAAAVFEVLDRDPNPAWDAIEVQVCPGISAMQAAAAQVGAPLGHDFCAISLSNILKPWEVIAERISAAAQADFAIAFYNPVSRQRTWQLAAAKEILLQWRSAETPIVLARDVGRPGQAVVVKSLAALEPVDADMRTVILVGSSQTRQIKQPSGKQWIYTPRHYH